MEATPREVAPCPVATDTAAGKHQEHVLGRQQHVRDPTHAPTLWVPETREVLLLQRPKVYRKWDQELGQYLATGNRKEAWSLPEPGSICGACGARSPPCLWARHDPRARLSAHPEHMGIPQQGCPTHPPVVSPACFLPLLPSTLFPGCQVSPIPNPSRTWSTSKEPQQATKDLPKGSPAPAA